MTAAPRKPSTAANLTANNSVDNTVFSIDASHIYADEGAYTVTIAVTDTDGATTTISSTAIIADALLTPFNPQPAVTQVQPTIFPVPQFGAPAFTGAVAYFTDAAGSDGSAADFTATIDWGDGTPPSVRHDRARPDGQSGRHLYRIGLAYLRPKGDLSHPGLGRGYRWFQADRRQHGDSHRTAAHASPAGSTRPATAVSQPATPTSPTSFSRPSPAPSSPPFPRGRRSPKQTPGSPSRPRSTA